MKAKAERLESGYTSEQQRACVEYVQEHPGCSVADIRRGSPANRKRALSSLYNSINRLRSRGLLRAARGPGNRLMLYLRKRAPRETELRDSVLPGA